jgi:hypothetical protein
MNIVCPFFDPVKLDAEIGRTVVVECLLKSVVKIYVANDLRQSSRVQRLRSACECFMRGSFAAVMHIDESTTRMLSRDAFKMPSRTRCEISELDNFFSIDETAIDLI